MDKFLVEILLDFYEQQLMALGEVSTPEEFDDLFYDDDGEAISDEEFLSLHPDEISDADLIDGVYYYLIDDGVEFDFNIKQIIAHFVTKYIYNNYGNDEVKNIIRYLKNTDVNSIIELFLQNEHFAKDLIRDYVVNFDNDLEYEDIRQELYENDDEDLINKWGEYMYQIYSLNQFFRNIISELYDKYISNGVSDIEALSLVWEYFIRDFDPVGALEGVDLATKQKYKIYMLKLIYCDVYEDVCNKSIIDSENEMDRMAQVYIVNNVSHGCVGIPGNPELRNRIMKHFIILQDEKKKRQNNRKKTIEDGRGPILKKINPGYVLDEIDFYNLNK